MKKILLSLLSIGVVAVVALVATQAFFSDTETSKDNSFTAGEIDLKIDNDSYIDQGSGLVRSEGTTWGFPDGQDDPLGLFFNFTDLKPGDNGEDTISIHLSSNPAWMCVDLDITTNSDETCTEPEDDADAENGACFPETDGTNGDLAGDLNFFFWLDDGDNVFETNEVELTHGPAQNVLGGVTWALADSQTNGGQPFEPTVEGPYYIGKAWCYGTLTMVPRDPQEGDGGPDERGGGYTCDGELVGNEGQTDLLKGDITFRAVQSRHNPEFVCARPQLSI